MVVTCTCAILGAVTGPGDHVPGLVTMYRIAGKFGEQYIW